MNRQAQTLLLLLVGGALLRVSLSDIYLRYVRAGLQPLLIGAGATLVLTAAATAWYELRPARRAPEPPRTEHAEHAEHAGHPAHWEPRVAWLLAVVVIALVVVTPPPLGSYTAYRTGAALQRPAGYSTLPAGDPLKLTVDDYAGRAVFDHGRSLGQRRVDITGFITVGGRGVPYLTRLVLSCCAADARPVKVALTGQVPDGLRPDMWLEVTGRYTARQTSDDINHAAIPYIEVSQAWQVPQPADQYEN